MDGFRDFRAAGDDRIAVHFGFGPMEDAIFAGNFETLQLIGVLDRETLADVAEAETDKRTIAVNRL